MDFQGDKMAEILIEAMNFAWQFGSHRWSLLAGASPCARHRSVAFGAVCVLALKLNDIDAVLPHEEAEELAWGKMRRTMQ